MNAVEIEAAISDLAIEPYNAVKFPFAFLAAFGNKDTVGAVGDLTIMRQRAGLYASTEC